MILVNVTFEIVTHESAEHGDAADRGFISEDESMSFRELVEWMRGGETSCSPARGEPFEWVTQDQGETRAYLERGERESRSIHFSRSNAQRKNKYWAHAMRAAGLIKIQGAMR